MICRIWTRSPMLRAQGWESCRTETCPVNDMTLAAASPERGNNWAKDTGAGIMASNATNPRIPLLLIKKQIKLADFTLKYYVAYNPANLYQHSLPSKVLSKKVPVRIFFDQL